MTEKSSNFHLQNQFHSTSHGKHSLSEIKWDRKSTNSNFQSNLKNHHHCTERELLKKSFQMVNQANKTISKAFPLWEISFVISHGFLHIFVSIWAQNDPFLRCEFLTIVQRGNSIFYQCFVTKQYLLTNSLCSLCGRWNLPL